MIVLPGPSAALQGIASQLKGLKGIYKGKLVMANAEEPQSFVCFSDTPYTLADRTGQSRAQNASVEERRLHPNDAKVQLQAQVIFARPWNKARGRMPQLGA